ncbi:MAG: oxidoreductase [Oscillospiraceae bacterium]|nr:oxidoreductase [Oscillospiraceae bacterium]
MKQTARIISTYSADVFGVCSALYELGGMCVMHDASGCNSTYSTHDEPRWYDMDSMVYISAVSEMEALMGDDEKLIGDIVRTAADLHPKFIAIAGTPIPTMTGFDFRAVASLIEQRTGIPAFGFPTTGMNTYVRGASMALAAVAERFVENREKVPNGVNILGLTPLDFSVNGADRSIAAFLEEHGFRVVSRWAMGCDLEALSRAAEAQVNLVVSAAGLGAAKELRERFGIPYVVGVPIGAKQKERLSDMLRKATADGKNRICRGESVGDIAVIGEGVNSLALAAAIELETGRGARVLCATECDNSILRPGDLLTPDEDDIIPALSDVKTVVADPLYKPICPPEARFVPLPTEAFSGRIFRKQIPNLIADFDSIQKEVE